MAEELNLDDLVAVETGELSEEDKNKYDGTKVKIAKAYVKPKKTKYGPDGKQLPEGQTLDTFVTILETESVGLNNLGQPIVVKEEFNLKKHPVTGKWGPSLHEKSKSKKLFNKFKINTFKEVIGQSIVVVKKASEKNPSKTWLGFAI